MRRTPATSWRKKERKKKSFLEMQNIFWIKDYSSVHWEKKSWDKIWRWIHVPQKSLVEALVLHRQKKKRRKRGKIVYLDGIHYHYSCIVSPLFIMTRINVLPGMHTLDNRGGYYLVKSSSPMGKRAWKNKKYPSLLMSYKDSTLPL